MNTVLGRVYAALDQRQWRRARARCEVLLRDHGDSAAVHHAAGLARCGEAAFEAAAMHFGRAVALEPDITRWRRDHGLVLAKLGRAGAAITALTPLVQWLDEDALALYLVVARDAKRAAAAIDAIDSCGRALPLDQAFLCAYGAALGAAGRPDDAQAALRAALRRNPLDASLHEALAGVYEDAGQPDLALTHLRERARLSPHSGPAQLHLALGLSTRGLPDESRERRMAACTCGLDRLSWHSVKHFIMLSDPQATAADLKAAARECFAPVSPATPPIRRTPRRSRARLRVGYVNGEGVATPAYFFFSAFLRRHDRATFEVTQYSTSRATAAYSAEYQGWTEHWRDVTELSDAALLSALRADQLDVLVDLSGHFVNNRLGVFAERVAPVQVTYPNYPSTTGCPGVDYFLTDAWTSPPGTEAEYSERLYRLDCGYLMFEPPITGPLVAPLPLARNGNPTFGLFQRLDKCNALVWDAVAEVMRRVPDALLLFQNGDAAFDQPGSETARRVLAELADRGVARDRVRLQGPLPSLDRLRRVGEVDVALDTFPYNGQTTTLDALWMGVPVVTLDGSTHVGRVCAALLTRVGHPEWVGSSQSAYAGIATALVNDPAALGRIRAKLRADVLSGGLNDGARLARALEAAYREMVAWATAPEVRRRPPSRATNSATSPRSATA